LFYEEAKGVSYENGAVCTDVIFKFRVEHEGHNFFIYEKKILTDCPMLLYLNTEQEFDQQVYDVVIKELAKNINFKFLGHYLLMHLGVIDETKIFELALDTPSKRVSIPYKVFGELGYMGPDGVRLLIKALKNGDSNVRAWAAEALGETGDQRAVVPLTKVLQTEQARYVRDAAQKALDRIGNTGGK
jgi:hypothetical protein